MLHVMYTHTLKLTQSSENAPPAKPRLTEPNRLQAVRDLAELLPMSDVQVARQKNESSDDESGSSIDEAPVAGVSTQHQ